MLGAAGLLVLGCSASPGTATGGTSTPGGSAPGTATPGTSAAPGSTTTTKVLQETYGAKACTLLTIDEMAPLLGFTPVAVATTPASFLGGGFSSACDFRHPQDPDRKGKTARILVFPPKSSIQAARRAMTDDKDVSDLPVPAFVGRAAEQTGSGPNTIVVDVPDQAFSITVVTGTDRTADDVVALAKLALPRFEAVPHGETATPAK